MGVIPKIGRLTIYGEELTGMFSVLAEVNVFSLQMDLNFYFLLLCDTHNHTYIINWVWSKACWLILTISKLSCKIINDKYCMYLYFIYFYKLINKIVINQLITYWPSYGSSIGCIGPRPPIMLITL